MPSLFIIGNGFDLAHGLPTRYSNFRDFIEKEYSANKNIPLHPPEIIMGNHGVECPDSTVVASLVTRLLINADVEDDWKDFEEKLGELDYDEFFDHIEDIGSDQEDNPFIIAYQMEDASSSLLHSIPYIQELFQEWVDTIQIEQQILQKPTLKRLFKPEIDAFLNFNYTLTLEKLYNCKNVCHIHGKQGDDILVGHGDDTDEAGSFDNVRFPGAICNLSDLKKALRKDTRKALKENGIFFKSLSGIDKIYSIGFSYSSVDLIYMQEICRKLNHEVVWVFDDYPGNEELSHYKNIISECGYTGKFETCRMV